MKVFSYNPNRFRNSGRDDIDRWLSLYNMINTNVSFLDRTGHIVMPFNTAVPAQLQMPVVDRDFSKSYELCCQEQVQNLMESQDRLDVPIHLLYSGGIDSSLILTSFIKQLGLANTEKRIRIIMSVDSIEENPWMWEKIIRRSDLKIIPGESHATNWSTNRILVGGEFNDQLMGSDVYKDLVRWKGNEILDKKWNENLFYEYHLYKGLTDAHARHWAVLFSNHIASCTLEISTVADAWWWINFSCKWSAVYFRLLMHVYNNEIINQEYLDQYYCQFYGSPDFQKWSMTNRTHKHKGTWLSYKWHAKQLVCDFLQDNSFMSKVKRGSLWTLLSYKNPAILIDDQYKYHFDIDINAMHNEENSFKTNAKKRSKTRNKI
jgi:hypothetical protein